eukprot:TRINITY_DN1641_c0_g1_i1.p2 TRINITY_DN1641_c0_g1~~TRINITY_DN1641_c0_g1_i1.p2  ORF type:complete len:192 (-),score=8.70 TRINITY_DN1641_c0_g1_i1:134-709(-)
MKASILLLIAFLGVAFAAEQASFSLYFSTPSTTEETPFQELVKGFLEGLKEVYDSELWVLEDCMSCRERIWADWMEFLKDIKEIILKPINWYEIIGTAIVIVADTLYNALPCLMVANSVEKVVELIVKPSWKTLTRILLMSMIFNARTIYNDLSGIVKAVMAGDYFSTGRFFAKFVCVIVIHQPRQHLRYD